MLRSIAPHFDKQGDFDDEDDTSFTYIGVSNTLGATVADIRDSDMCPKYGQLDPQHPGNYITSVNVRPFDTDGPGYEWLITTRSNNNFQLPKNPLDEPASIVWETQAHQSFATRDRDGELMLNKARDIVGVMREDDRWVLRVSKKLARPPAYLLDYNNAINKSAIRIDGIQFPKEKLMCKGVRIGAWEEAEYLGRTIRYRVVSFNLHYRKEGYTVYIDNVGYNELHKGRFPAINRDTGEQEKDSSGRLVFVTKRKKRRIMIGDPPQTPTEPQVLDKNGKYVEDAEAGDVIKLEFDVYPTRPFNRLPLR